MREKHVLGHIAKDSIIKVARRILSKYSKRLGKKGYSIFILT